MRLRLVCVVVVLGIALLMSAAPRSTAQQEPEFAQSTALVQIDAVVLDDQGIPVTKDRRFDRGA